MGCTYADLYNNLRTWNASYSIPDDLLNYYINRGEKYLIEKLDIPDTMLIEELTVTDKSASYPTTMNVKHIGYDTDDDNSIEIKLQYKRDYNILSTFTRASGKTRTINFFDTPQYTVLAEGKVIVEDFADQTATTQYSIFDSIELVLSACKYLILKDTEVQKEVALAFEHLQKQISLYKRDRTLDRQTDIKPLDDNGNELSLNYDSL